MNNWNDPQTVEEDFPLHLTSYDELRQHFEANLQGLNSTQKGLRFASSMRKLIPQTEAGADFTLPVLNPRISHDEGVDLKAEGIFDTRRSLYIQSKLWMHRTEEIDTVISKFQAYEQDHQAPRRGSQLAFDFDNLPPAFLLVTLSPIKSLLRRYEERNFSSKSFYLQCKAEQRIKFIDGYDILNVLKAAYIKISGPPTELELKLENAVIQKDNVFIGIVSSDEIKRLYSISQDSLFFENVRDFRGITPPEQKRAGRTTPNDEIVKTLTESPEKMLGRNNGIVFKANNIKVKDDLQTLILKNGSIINGCQTAMCLVEAAKDLCYVLVKVVQTSDAWDITKAANLQNNVDQIDLDIARIVREQLVKRAAVTLGARLSDSHNSAFQIIDDIYNQRVAYAEVRLLFIGLFSRTPNNVFVANYTELLQMLMESFYKEDKYGTRIYEVLFLLQENVEKGIEKAKDVFSHNSYSADFERIYSERSLTYRCFFGILAICAAININIAVNESSDDTKRRTKRSSEIERKDDDAEYERMKEFLKMTLVFLQDHQKEFLEYYHLAVKVWMDTVDKKDAESLETKVNMHGASRSINFTNLFVRVCREADFAHRKDN